MYGNRQFIVNVFLQFHSSIQSLKQRHFECSLSVYNKICLQLRNILYIALIVLAIFQSISTILGGIALLANVISMPVELLQGSPFRDYTIPGLALSLLAGGSSLFASILLFRKSKFAILFSTTAGVVMMFFEFVEVLVIGSPAGIARMLQIVYFDTGTAMVVAAMGVWFLDLQST